MLQSLCLKRCRIRRDLRVHLPQQNNHIAKTKGRERCKVHRKEPLHTPLGSGCGWKRWRKAAINLMHPVDHFHKLQLHFLYSNRAGRKVWVRPSPGVAVEEAPEDPLIQKTPWKSEMKEQELQAVIYQHGWRGVRRL